VNWPKLNTPQWAIEGYSETLRKVQKNPVLGSVLKGHERGRSKVNVEYMEEGKTRIE
jgi:phosphatidylinositol 4-phosphatase